MINFLNEIFLAYSFKTENVKLLDNNILLAQSNHGLSNYIVLNLNKIDGVDIDKITENLYEMVFNSNKWSNVHLKNTIFVISVHQDEDNNQEQSILFQEIEENKFLFKKHIFSYTSYEKENLVDSYKKSEKSIREFLDTKILSAEDFRIFKKQENYLSGYGLLLKVYIKLPFISLKSQSLAFSTVSQDITDQIIEKKLTEVQKFSFNLKKESTLEEFLSKLKTLGEL